MSKAMSKGVDATWVVAILKSIQWIGNRTRMGSIYKKVGDYKELTAEDFKPWQDGRPTYQFTVRSTVYNFLMPNGLVKRVSRDTYALTESGVAFLRNEEAIRELAKLMKEKGVTLEELKKLIQKGKN